MNVDQVRLKIWREIERLGSQSEFARKAGVTHQYVNQVIRGKQPPGQSLLSILDPPLVRIVEYRRI